MDFLTDNAGVLAALVVFVVFALGLFFALRTEGGRDALGAAAVRLAVAALAMAERWLGGRLEPVAASSVAAPPTDEIAEARAGLQAWLARREG